MQGRPPIMGGGLQLAAMLEEEEHELRAGTLGCQVPGGGAFRIRRRHTAAQLHQPLHHLQPPAYVTASGE